MLCKYHLIVFSPFVNNLNTQYDMGWVFIVILTSGMVINSLYVLMALYRGIRLTVVKYYRRCKKTVPIKLEAIPKTPSQAVKI